MTDPELLRQYAETGSHEAFAELVSHHSAWIYSAALRLVRRRDWAEDITQAVFMLLAQRAKNLSTTSLNGWLFKVTRYCASTTLREENRREKRERQAAIMNSQNHESLAESTWDDITPILEQTVSRLKIPDRNAILLRFYQQKSMSEVGDALGVSEDAARKRVTKALVKLREYMLAQGVVLPPAEAAITLLSKHTAHAAPPTLLPRCFPGAGTARAIGIAHRANQMLFILKLKMAMTILAVMLISTGLWIGLNRSSAGRSDAPASLAAPIAATAPSAEPLDQSTPEAALHKLSAAIRQDDSAGIEACASFVDRSDQENADAIRTTFSHSAACCRLDHAWMTAFGTHMKIDGFEMAIFPGLQGGLEEIFDRTLSGLKPGDVQIHGDTATIRVHVPNKNMDQYGQGAWDDASLVMRRQGNQWRLDAPATIRLEIILDPPLHDPRGVLIRMNDEAGVIMRKAADEIESGELKTSKEASDELHLALWKSMVDGFNLKNFAIHNLPRNRFPR